MGAQSITIPLSILPHLQPQNPGEENAAGDTLTREFQVSRAARDKYRLDLSMFTITGEVIFANFHAARVFAQKINEERDLIRYPEQAVSAAEINAMGLIHEILHHMITRYREQVKPTVFEEALERLSGQPGKSETDKTLRLFLDEFPPLAVYRKEISIDDYLPGQSGGIDNRQIALEELLLLWLSNNNPAFLKYGELFNDSLLKERTVYPKMMTELEGFFEEQPFWGPTAGGQNLIKLLRSPAILSPHSVVEQLHYMRHHWHMYLGGKLRIKWELLLGEGFLDKWGMPSGEFDTRLLRGIDFITEEQKIRFNPALGPAPTEVPDFFYQEEEPEQFSADLHWMPRLVLIAKSTLVWLDQLSKKYQRAITRLDQIPDEELDTLARWGITGLWLIGIWERSQASKEIKRMCGNPEAQSSAYSLFDYQVAAELGGEEGYLNLKERCRKRGLRLGSDMVPNHTGIDSKWIREHSDWYIQLPYSPFPSYSFNGPNLSHEANIGIYLEDHYYNRSDAAVVFKRVDFRSGETRYIYHGNDGTSMPWNDTAQLNYLKPEVREAVIQSILAVAKQFSIIRFDAAMTLAKRHFHRLWFPQPGSGGDIPSRAEHGMTRARFDELMPVEFWREVVDRVAEEAPDTLLLAEAFWLMEGYFVRTLGMHRVYNSAFMNMLKNEENQKYRYTIKNTIEFEPEVLKRYVNFMNNPDEDTAIAQFGDGDKYFGVCMMMATMPGLPMFGHGQIEGFREKYGMEYRRAYYDEQPNQYLVERHEREIFPILKKRYLFAEVENFLLYDFYAPDGGVDEDVFAYSNRFANERSLVIFHNAYKHTRGWIRTSAAFSEKEANGQSKRLVQKTLGEGLNLQHDNRYYTICRDYVSGREYIRHSKTLVEQGMYVELGAYQYHVFLDYREVQDSTASPYARLAESLEGRGVPSIEEALRELHLQPLHQACRVFMNADTLRRFMKERSAGTADQPPSAPIGDLVEQYRSFIAVAQNFESLEGSPEMLLKEIRRKLAAAQHLTPAFLRERFPLPKSRKYRAALSYLEQVLQKEKIAAGVLFNWVFVHATGWLLDGEKESNEQEYIARSRSWIDQWLLYKIIISNLKHLGLDESTAQQLEALIKLLTTHQHWFRQNGPPARQAHRLLNRLFKDQEFQSFLQVNRYNGVLWFNKEAFETAVGWLFVIATLQYVAFAINGVPEVGSRTASISSSASSTGQVADSVVIGEDVARKITAMFAIVEKWLAAERESDYQVDKLLDGLISPSRKDRPQYSKSSAKHRKQTSKKSSD